MQQHWSHDIRDPEAFVGRIVEQRGGDLNPHQRERLHQFLLIALWELSRGYNNTDGWSSFSGYAGSILPRRVTDFHRSPEEGGRTKWHFSNGTHRNLERVIPALVSLDDPVGGADPGIARDVTPDRSTDLLRILGDRDSSPAGPESERGEAQTDRAA